MLSARLVRTIEQHAEQLTREVVADLRQNPRTPAYHALPAEELRLRAHNVYSNLGGWIGEKDESAIVSSYTALGQTRHAEGIPLSEVVFALMRLREHLREYVSKTAVSQSAVELYQEEELNLLIDRFFDKAIYHTVRGYETAPATR